MAAPHVAGAAALLRQRHPDWTVGQIKSALVTTGNSVAANGRQAPPTRVGGGMIWIPRADQPLLFAVPTSLSFGYLRRGQARTLSVALADAGGGLGAWSVSVQKSVSPRGISVSAPGAATVPGKVTLRASVARSAADSDASGYLVLTRGTDVRRIPYWLHVTAAEARPRARAPAPRPRHVPRQHAPRPRARLDVQVSEQSGRHRRAQQPSRAGAGLPFRPAPPGRERGRSRRLPRAPAST